MNTKKQALYNLIRHHRSANQGGTTQRLSPLLLRELGKLGILGAPIPVEFGGQGMSHQEVLAWVEQLAAIDLGLASFVVLHYTSTLPYIAHALPSLQQKLFPALAEGICLAAFALTETEAGSNPRAMQTTVQQDERGNYCLHGQKTWCGNAEWADFFLCFARHKDKKQHFSAFCVPKEAQGLHIKPEIKSLGIHNMTQNPIVLDGVELPPDALLGKSGEGLLIAEHSLSFGRLCTGAIALGCLKRCAQVLDRFTKRRQIHTGRLRDHPLTQQRLLDISYSIQALTALLNTLLQEESKGTKAPQTIYMMLKVAASELLWNAVDRTLQMLGSRGYAESNGIAQMLRDARFLRIGEGPSETLLAQIGASFLHQEPSLWVFLDNIGREKAPETLEQLRQLRQRYASHDSPEQVYAPLGELALWSLLTMLLSTEHPSAQFASKWAHAQFVTQEQKVRLAGQYQPSMFTRWDSAQSRYNEEIGTIEDSWFVPLSRMDPYLQKNFTPPQAPEAPLSQHHEQEASLQCRDKHHTFKFRVDFPTDHSFRSLVLPKIWKCEPAITAELFLSIQQISQGWKTSADRILFSVFQAWVQRFSGLDVFEVLEIQERDSAFPCQGRLVQFASETSAEDLTLDPSFTPVWNSTTAAMRQKTQGGSNSCKLIAGGISIGFGIVSSIPQARSFEDVDLMLCCQMSEQRIQLYWLYDSSVFEETTITRRHQNFFTMLKAFVKAPASPLSHLEILPLTEQEQMVTAWSGAKTRPSFYTHTLHGLVEQQATKTPTHLALQSPNEQWTYEQLDRKANQIAHALQERGLQQGQFVGICTSRAPSMVLGLLGALKAGACFVLLNPEHPLDRLRWLLEESRAQILLVDQQTAQKRQLSQGLQVLPLDHEQVQVAQKSKPPCSTKPHDAAYIMFTSGSTGKPKGVLLPHQAISNQLLARCQALGLNNTDAVLQTAAPNFDIVIWELLGPLVFGGCVVFSGEEVFTWSPTSIKALITRYQITTLQIVPSQLSVLLDHIERGELSSLRHVISGGEQLPLSLQRRFFELLPAQLYNFYGPTEGAIDTSWYHCNANQHTPSAPIGKPCLNRQVYVVDDKLRLQPIGVEGELLIGGVGLALGYFQQPEMTLMHFLDNAFLPVQKERLYRTGDKVRWRNDGNLEFLGRVDRQVKIRGVRIEPGEIELSLCQHPSIQSCAVVARRRQNKEKCLVAYLKTTQTIPEKEIRDFAHTHLPQEFVPSAFVVLEQMPVTSTGKLDLKALPAVNWDNLGQTQHTTAEGFDTAQERQMAKIWSEVLNVSVEHHNTDFFTIGGHSLLAIRVLSRIKDVWGVDIPIDQFFTHTTLQALTACLEQHLVSHSRSQPGTSAQLITTPTLVFVPHKNEGEQSYDTLCASVSTPSIVLEPSYIYGRPQSPDELLQEATLYLQQLPKTQGPNSLFILVGKAWGGLLALEIAAQLRQQQGQQVAGVVLIDCPHPTEVEQSEEMTLHYQAPDICVPLLLLRSPAHQKTTSSTQGWMPYVRKQLFLADIKTTETHEKKEKTVKDKINNFINIIHHSFL